MLSQAKEKHCDAWQLRNHFYFAAVMETAKRQPNEQWDFNSSRRQELCPWTCPHLFESITRKAGKKIRKESRDKIKTGHIHRFLDIYKIESCSTIFRDKRNKLRIWPNNRLPIDRLPRSRLTGRLRRSLSNAATKYAKHAIEQPSF